MRGLKSVIKGTARRLAPDWAARTEEYWWLRKKAAELLAHSKMCASPADYVDALAEYNYFRASQKRSEIVGLLEMIRNLQPEYVSEIGADQGGSLFLFSRVCPSSADIISIDINYSPLKRRLFPRFARKGQKITCLQADSHAESTRHKLEMLLDGRKLDFLFIDGDHSYHGVARDFQLYSPLVRNGGLIAFHDIVPDFKTRFGVTTGSDVGEVPRFWRELRDRFDNCVELVDHPEQDGFGIGVISWPG